MKARWVVEGAEAGVEEILERMRDPSALGDGRAFVNGARARAGARVQPGDVVEVWAARGRADAPLEILHREEDFIAVNKPAALATIADHRGDASLAAIVAAALGGGAEPHAVSRLDVGVSGVVLFATTRRGSAELDEATRSGALAKLYVGIAKGELAEAGRFDAPVAGKPAGTRFRTLGAARGATLVALRLETGRLHQIREHLAGARAPLFGDRRRRGPSSVVASDGRVLPLDRILLHASRVRLARGGRTLEIIAPVPLELREAWSALDGDERAWNALERVDP
ncbi:MAG: RluA family pseudouridine synthase [Polyangiaceae bacterium]